MSDSLFVQAPAGLDVQVPDRQRLIGSPAPQSFRNKLQERQQRFKKVRPDFTEEREEADIC